MLIAAVSIYSSIAVIFFVRSWVEMSEHRLGWTLGRGAVLASAVIWPVMLLVVVASAIYHDDHRTHA